MRVGRHGCDNERVTPLRSSSAAGSAEIAVRAGSGAGSKIRYFLTVALLVLAADIVSKVVIVANIGPDHRPVRLLGGLVYLVQARNSGAAFSVGTGATVILTVVAASVAVVIARAARSLTSAWWAVSLGLILGGALGNLVDRFLRAPSPGRGHVVDWIQLHSIVGYDYPIFNLADSAICVGAVIALILSVRGVEFRSHRPAGADNPPSTDRPSTDRPSTDPSGTDRPSTDRPTTDRPSTDWPSTDRGTGG